MEESETYCVRVGYNAMHLSTHDQQGFYHHLGYQDGPSVNGRRKCVTNLTENQVQYIVIKKCRLNFEPSRRPQGVCVRVLSLAIYGNCLML